LRTYVELVTYNTFVLCDIPVFAAVISFPVCDIAAAMSTAGVRAAVRSGVVCVSSVSAISGQGLRAQPHHFVWYDLAL